MERFWETCKEHPYWIGGGVLFVIILMYFHSSTTTSATTATGSVVTPTTDPNVLAQQTSEFDTTDQDNTALSIASLQAGVQTANTNAQASAYDAAANASLGAAQATATSNTSIAQANDAASVQLAGLQTSAAETIGQQQSIANMVQNEFASLVALNASGVTTMTATATDPSQSASAVGSSPWYWPFGTSATTQSQVGATSVTSASTTQMNGNQVSELFQNLGAQVSSIAGVAGASGGAFNLTSSDGASAFANVFGNNYSAAAILPVANATAGSSTGTGTTGG